MTGSGPVFLHIGLPKTGTTYLQNLLWSHQDPLREQGLLLPGFGPREHLWASCDVREEPRLARRDRRAPGAWGRLAAELVAWPGPGLVTHEFLCGASADQVGRALEQLGDREVHVVVTAREIVSLVTARWQEWVKNGATGEIDAYPASEGFRPADEWGWGTLDLADILDRWRVHVPPERIHLVCPPAADEPREELWRRFAAVVGLDPAGMDASRAPSNASLGVVEVELLRRVNAELASAGGFKRPVERGSWIRGYLAQQKLAPLGDERFWPGPERVSSLRSRGDQGLRRVEVGGYDVIGSLDQLRTPPTLPSRRHPSEVTDAEVVSVSARLVASMLADVRSARAKPPAQAEPAPTTTAATSAARPGRERGLSQPERAGGVGRVRRLWQGGPGRARRRTDG